MKCRAIRAGFLRDVCFCRRGSGGLDSGLGCLFLGCLLAGSCCGLCGPLLLRCNGLMGMSVCLVAHIARPRRCAAQWLPPSWRHTSSLPLPLLRLKQRGATSTSSTLTRMHMLMKSWPPRGLLLQAWERGPQHPQRDRVPVPSMRSCWRIRPKQRMTSPSWREGKCVEGRQKHRSGLLVCQAVILRSCRSCFSG